MAQRRARLSKMGKLAMRASKGGSEANRSSARGRSAATGSSDIGISTAGASTDTFAINQAVIVPDADP
ncbi:hypothetical protein GGH20_003063, partial [Coemansia sp. RSA 1937]